MTLKHYLLSSLFGISVCLVGDSVANEAIIDGDEAEIDQFPYQVSLHIHGHGHGCGGSIIGDEFILTAAHCVVTDGQIDDWPMSVIAGTNNLLKIYKSAVIGEVDKIFVPTEYNTKDVFTTGDIAILKLKEPLGLSSHRNLKQLNLPKESEDDYAGKIAEISGFGWNRIKVESKNKRFGYTDGQLRFAKVDILNHCLTLTVPKEQLCARVQKRDHMCGVCVGDSGGPLVHHETVVGILSIAPTTCTEKKEGAIYTRVSHYLKFIDDAIHDRDTSEIRKHELPRNTRRIHRTPVKRFIRNLS